ncbi:MAG: NAD-dependent epimerase/dehydratase family protein [Elusimicrobia bacterium]|nr:NAD-dependent epimerase/dehydratase family protein [Elusimicrobiota bacterium]
MATHRTQTILITGAGGFLAAPLACELRRRRPRARLVLASRRGLRGCRACDLTGKKAALRLVERFKPGLIYHLAGTTKPASPRALHAAHVETTVNLLEAALRLEPRPRVIVAGSSAEYGRAAGARPLGEDDATSPATPYGISKLAQTRAALSFRKRGLDVVVARIFNAIGPGTPANLAPGAFASQLARLARDAGEGRMTVGNLESRRDFVDARDIARALADLARPGADAPIYNVCSGRGVAIKRVLKRLIELSRVRVRVDRTAGQAGSSDIPVIAGSRRRLSRDSGWRPRITLERSLRDMLTWYRRND